MDNLETMTLEADEAAKWFEDFVKNPKPTEQDFKKARLITSHRSTQVRAHSAVTAREKVRFSFAKVLSGGDSNDMQKYLEASKPKE